MSKEIKLYAASGRECGDDDDSMILVWAPNDGEAQAIFEDQLKAESREDEPTIFFNGADLIGTLTNEGFKLEASLLASGLAALNAN